jgi:PQQ-dependent dehydrogenase (methanol/ethanol family)
VSYPCFLPGMRHRLALGAIAILCSSAFAAADVDAGKTVFANQCSSCHTTVPGKNGFGPSLAGVIGRHAGTAPDYKYTDAMANSGLTWDEKTLDSFLTSTTAKVPGTAMAVALPNEKDRAAVIAYLETLGVTTSADNRASSPVAEMPPAGAGPTQDELTHAASDTKNWLYASKDYSGQRFVNLAQINTRNAHQLRAVCMIRSETASPTQTSLLIYKGIMYASVDATVVAFDAVTCRKRWTYKWNAKGHSISATNRGVAIKDGILVRGTSDGYLIALNMEKGQLLWSRQIADSQAGQYLSMPPLIFQDLVFYGPAGADFGAKNWVGAFKLTTGEPVWRFNLIPDDNEAGADTWQVAGSRQHGGGSLWTPLALDAQKGILYLPVGNPAPDFYGDARTGDDLYTNSVVALEARSGKLLWYRQFGPNDVHDADLSQVSPLFSGKIDGKSRNLMTVSGKDGLLRVMDRDTRDVLFELPITTRENADAAPTVDGIHRCPGLLGGMEWNGPAYSPVAKTIYVAAVDWCGTFKRSADKPDFVPAAHYYGGAVIPDARGTSKGWLTAIDSTTGKVRWRQQWPTPLVAAVTTTSGGVLFTGDLNNDFLVLDAATGKTLYRFNTGGSIGGGVVTYEVGGKQYVATTSGVVSGFFGGSGTSSVIVFALP